MIFYPRRMAEMLGTYIPALWYLARLELLRWRIRRDPAARNYSDIAISPAAQDDNKLFELYRRTGAGHASRTAAQAQVSAGAAP
jgi:hypothetical protein